MADDQSKQKERKERGLDGTTMAIGAGLGIALGAAIGSVIGNVGNGVAFGFIAGAALGLIAGMLKMPWSEKAGFSIRGESHADEKKTRDLDF